MWTACTSRDDGHRGKDCPHNRLARGGAPAAQGAAKAPAARGGASRKRK